MRSTRFLVMVLAASVVLTGCQGLQPTAPPTPAPVPPSSSPAPEEQGQQRETGLTRPATVFGGQCDALFSPAELESTMGESLGIRANHFVELWGGGGVIDQAGGLMCTWRGIQSVVIAIVLPEAAVDYLPYDEACSGGGTHNSFDSFCRLEEIANGTRLSVWVSGQADPVTLGTQRDVLRAIFLDRIATRDPVPVPIPALGSWLLPPDCAAVVAGADLSAVPGLGSATGDVGGGYGKDGPQAEFAVADGWSPPTCVINGSGATVEFAPIGGSRWKEESIAARADATALALEGVEAAYGVPYRDGLTLVYAFDGPNMLMFTVRHTKNAAGIATALIASLNATAVT